MTRSVQVEPQGDREILVRREFDAPRERVFAALTEPELVKRWLGPRSWRLSVCEIDLRPGGRWYYVSSGPEGQQMVMHGEFLEIRAPELLLTSETNEDCEPRAGRLTTVRTTLEDLDGRTRLTMVTTLPDQPSRDGLLASGMAYGVGEGYEQLDELLTDEHVRQVAERYHRRADAFEAKVAQVAPDQWAAPSPCAEWDARGVVEHIVMMHGAMVAPIGRTLTAGTTVAEDPLAAFRAARADVAALLADEAVANQAIDAPMGPTTVADHIDQVVSTDLVIHGWDLARATGQDDTIDPDELTRAWPGVQQIPDIMRQPGAFGPGIVVFGPVVEVPDDAPLQHRFLGLLGRDPEF